VLRDKTIPSEAYSAVAGSVEYASISSSQQRHPDSQVISRLDRPPTFIMQLRCSDPKPSLSRTLISLRAYTVFQPDILFVEHHSQVSEGPGGAPPHVSGAKPV
jgi:hypothetical protein